jgi:hypothetical protein
MTTAHTATPISTRMATIAQHLGWEDTSYYGDTDYGLKQSFHQGTVTITLKWVPDGRHGIGEELASVSVIDGIGTTVFHVEQRDQSYMRSAVISAFDEYSETGGVQ